MDSESWKELDAVELVGKAAERLPLLIDQGGSDEFLAQQLRLELLTAACNAIDFRLS